MKKELYFYLSYICYHFNVSQKIVFSLSELITKLKDKDEFCYNDTYLLSYGQGKRKFNECVKWLYKNGFVSCEDFKVFENFTTYRRSEVQTNFENTKLKWSDKAKEIFSIKSFELKKILI